MRRSLALFMVICLLLLIPSPKLARSSKDKLIIIVFTGKLINLSPPVPPSGIWTQYRLAKYQVDQVCKGKFSQGEIVVDHFITSATEFDGVKLGDTVCVAVYQEKKISSRKNYVGIRGEDEQVKTYFIGSKIVSDQQADCRCAESALKAAHLIR
jgi:hypothetical protein